MLSHKSRYKVCRIHSIMIHRKRKWWSWGGGEVEGDDGVGDKHACARESVSLTLSHI